MCDLDAFYKATIGNKPELLNFASKSDTKQLDVHTWSRYLEMRKVQYHLRQ